MARFAEPADLAINLKDLRVLGGVQSGANALRLFHHQTLGRILIINNEVQHVEAWQALYHEPVVHLSAAFLPRLEDVLILGGGSLFAAREVLRYPSVIRCTLVDHDPEVLSLMKEHYPHARTVMGDPRFRYLPADAAEYLRNTSDNFDLIINDCFDVLAEKRCGIDIFALVRDRLKTIGACSDLVYRHILENEYVTETRKLIPPPNASIAALVTVPEYPGVLHALTVWGGAPLRQDARLPVNKTQLQWCATGSPQLEFYDPRYLPAHLYLPPFLRKLWVTVSA